MSVDPSTVAVALIVAVVGPVLLSLLNSRLRRKERAEDRADRLAVAAEVQEVKGHLETSNRTVNDKLDTIHTLVNSDMTAALQAQLVALENSLYLMEKNAAWEVAQGDDPSRASHSVIVATKSQIQELRVNLEDRVKAQANVDAQ